MNCDERNQFNLAKQKMKKKKKNDAKFPNAIEISKISRIN